MSIKQMIVQIASDYATARLNKDHEHDVCRIIKVDAPEILKETLKTRPYYGSLTFDGGYSIGKWAYSPWATVIHNGAIDENGKIRYNVAYIFSFNLDRVYLCLLMWAHTTNNRDVLCNNASILLTLGRGLPAFSNPNFSSGPINLNPPKSGGFPDCYRDGYVVGREYMIETLNGIPEEELKDDLIQLVDTYHLLAKKYSTRCLNKK